MGLAPRSLTLLLAEPLSGAQCALQRAVTGSGNSPVSTDGSDAKDDLKNDINGATNGNDCKNWRLRKPSQGPPYDTYLDYLTDHQAGDGEIAAAQKEKQRKRQQRQQRLLRGYQG